MPPITKYIEPKFTWGNIIQIALLLITLVGIYYGVVGRLDTQANEIDLVKGQVRDLQTDNLPTRMSVLESTIVQGRATRDKQNEEVVQRLDKMQDAIIALSNSVAALNATIRAQDARP